MFVCIQEERKLCKQLNDCIGIGIAHRKVGEALNETAFGEGLVVRGKHRSGSSQERLK